jgi:hypothetical protein
MPASIRRHALVLLLILGAAAAGAGLGGREGRTPALPAAGTLVDGGAWRVETAYAPGDAGGPFRQWQVRDAAGTEALLYVGATARAQTMVRWTGELGYEGDGYLVSDRSRGTIRLGDGSRATVSRVLVQHLDDRRLLEYAVVGPNGVAASGTDGLLGTAWDALSGRAGPYYMVRVSVPAGDAAAADGLLAGVLTRLSALARTG